MSSATWCKRSDSNGFPFPAPLAQVGLGLGIAVLAYTQLIKLAGPAAAVGVATLRKVVTVSGAPSSLRT